ncbi:MAG: HD domain-containing protein [Zetaproteobacteria bacterium]|nr:MAG: HD domain-containing protein [Zetaproteobacteria bacterium]
MCLDVHHLPVPLLTLCRRLRAAGGRPWLVGGSVRDLCLGIVPQDYDLEVFGLSEAQLTRALAAVGRVERCGKSFGVFKCWHRGHAFDVSLPRTERKTGSGHRGFAVQPDPAIDEKTASLRRDFTINAMMLDPTSGRLLDFHDGLRDLREHRLRHVSAAFVEDPLRPLRAMQFAARFQLTLAPDTARLCAEMLSEADSLPVARIWQEWRKWALAPHPSLGLRALRDSAWLQLYPELMALVDCPQDPRWHPEGDVWTHTCQAVDVAARLATEHGIAEETRITLLFAELCHDLGKPQTTYREHDGRIRSPGHAQAAAPLVARLFARIGVPRAFHAPVRALVAEHMCHLHGAPTPRAVRRLAHRLQPASIELWALLVEADASGRHPAPPSNPAAVWLEQAHTLAHARQPPKPIVTGKLLISLGMSPGPAFGRIIHKAYEAQLDGDITDKASARRWLQRTGALPSAPD